MSGEDQKKELFLNQKQLLDTFLEHGAISRAQYDKSLGDLIEKMGIRDNPIHDEEAKMDTRELHPNEMDSVSGGKGGSEEELPEMPGYEVYQIQRGDTLTKIARLYGTSVENLMRINRVYIQLSCDITEGYYIYVPV